MYSFQATTLDAPVEQAVGRVEQALRSQGFDTIQRLPLHETAQQTGKQLEPYVLLHAYDTNRALQALDHQREAGLLLSAIVVVREYGQNTLVQALDPPLLSLAGSQELQSLGDQLASSLRTALNQLDRQTAPSQQEHQPSGQQQDRPGDASSEDSAEIAEDVEQQLV